jgi:hypothetical protein
MPLIPLGNLGGLMCVHKTSKSECSISGNLLKRMEFFMYMQTPPWILTESSKPFFGFEWGGWYFTSNTIPFGWKLSAYVYHTTGSLVSQYFRSIGIPCSLYIDDRHNSKMRFPDSHPLPSSSRPPPSMS